MSLGEVLRQGRESSSNSLDDLASKTNIRAGLLSQMESNNFAGCGGDIYARGHLRTLAPHLKLDPEMLIDLYNNQHSSENRAIHEMLIENHIATSPTEGKRISWKALSIVSLALVGIIAIAQIIISNSNVSTSPPEVQQSAAASPSAETLQPSEPSIEDSKEPTQNTVSENSGSMKLTIAAIRGNSNIHVVTSGGTLYKGPILQGDEKIFSGKTSISLYLSNPGDLDLTLNGKKLAPLGGRNEEVRTTLRPNS